jgi:hypothetical protein
MPATAWTEFATAEHIAGADRDWSNVTNALVDDTSVATASFSTNPQDTDYVRFTNAGFALADTAKVYGVEVSFRYIKTSPFGSDIFPETWQLVNEGSLIGSNQGYTDSYSYFTTPQTAVITTETSGNYLISNWGAGCSTTVPRRRKKEKPLPECHSTHWDQT